MPGLKCQGSARTVPPTSLTGDPIPLSKSLSGQSLEHRIKVYIPSKDRNEVLIDPATRALSAAEIKTVLSHYAGGCTAFDGRGSWIDPIRGLVDEDVTVIESFSPAPFTRELLAEIVAIILSKLNQAAAAIIVGDKMLQFCMDDVSEKVALQGIA